MKKDLENELNMTKAELIKKGFILSSEESEKLPLPPALKLIKSGHWDFPWDKIKI